MAEELNQSEWGSMTAEQKQAEVDKGFESVQQSEVDTTPETEQIDTVIDDVTPVSDAPTPEDTGEGEVASDDQATEWLDDDTRDFASAMGLSDEDLSDFGSKEELERALRIIDRKAFEAGKAPQQPAPITTTPEPAPVQQPTNVTDPLAELAQFKLDEELTAYDAPKIAKAVGGIVAELKSLRETVSRFEQQDRQRSVDELRRTAIASLHSLGNAELFGKPGEKPTTEQAGNIEKAIDAHFTHARGLIATGRQAAPTPAFLKAAVNLAFGDQLSKIQKRQLTDKLRKQSARRTGGSAHKPLPQSVAGLDISEQVRRDPDIDKLFKELTASRNG